MVLAQTGPQGWAIGRLAGVTLRATATWAVLLLATVYGRAGILSPDYLFFAPDTLPEAVYPSQAMSGDGVNAPWQSVWTAADIAALDPGRYNISIVGADILPVLIGNPSSPDGSYTTSDLAAITLDNYRSWYLQQPGVDISDPATDYVADLTSNVLTVQFNAPAVYAVRVETYSSSTPGGPADEPRNYIYRQFVAAGFLEDGAPDAAGAQREVDIGDADIYVISDPTPADPVLDNAAAILTAKGKKVVRAKNLADAEKAICDESTAKGRKVKVNMIGHGRPGSINIGGERITDDADKKTTPAAFQKKVDKCTDGIAFTSCSTAKGDKGSKFLRDFANSVGVASGWTVAVTVEAAVKNKDGSVKKAGFFDVEATGKKMEDTGVRANEPIYSAPTAWRPAFFDVFFYGSDDGFLYAQDQHGGVVEGFPVDTREMGLPGTTDSVPIRSRPAIYFGTEAVPSLFLTTGMGHIVSVALDGTVRWVAWPDPTATNCSSTPAVTPEGSVFVAINGAGGPRVWKMDAATGAVQGQTPPLGLPASDSSALSVANNLVYLGVTQPLPGQGSLIVLDTGLTVRASGIATGEGVLAAPFTRGQFMYDGTLAGNFYKVNSVTTAPEPTFGSGGRVSLGEPMTAGPFAVTEDAGDTHIYTATLAGRLYRMAADGASSLLFDTGGLPIPGVVAMPFGPGRAVAFGAGHNFFVVPVSPPGLSFSYADRGLPGAGFTTTPVYVPSVHVFAIGNADGYLYAFPLS